MGTLVLFAHRREVAGLRALAEPCKGRMTVHVVPVRSIHQHSKYVRSIIKRITDWLPVDNRPTWKRRFLKFAGRPHVARYMHCQDYLARNTQYTHILLTDVRDVVFQSMPFAGLGAGLHVSMETPEITLGSEPFNRSWLLDAYGDVMLRHLEFNHVSCSGVTLGDRQSIDAYLTRMISEFMDQPYRKMRTRIYDQAMHNKLLHHNELGVCVRCKPLSSLIATVGCLQADAFEFSSDGKLLGEDGIPAAIVHQYDRHPLLIDSLAGLVLASDTQPSAA